MGSIIAAMVAIGKNVHDMEEMLATAPWISLIDFDMKKGLLSGEKIEAHLDMLFEGKTFADTRMPLYITATDINTGELIIITEGKLSQAVRASIGIP
jgi:NTE family protein